MVSNLNFIEFSLVAYALRTFPYRPDLAYKYPTYCKSIIMDDAVIKTIFNEVFFTEETSSVTLSPGTPTADISGYFHMFRSTNIRFFNNLAVVVRYVAQESCLFVRNALIFLHLHKKGLDLERLTYLH